MTLEPFYLRQTLLGDDLLADATLPIIALWSHELEALASSIMNADAPGQLLLDALIPADSNNARLRALSYSSRARNPILDDC